MKVLDTDACIAILRGNEAIISQREATPDTVATTWITASELAFGAAKSGYPRENQALVAEFLATLPVLGLDWPAAARFGAIKADLEQEGNRVADADVFIAAITLSRAAVLVTGNRKHFERMPDLGIEDWIRGR